MGRFPLLLCLLLSTVVLYGQSNKASNNANKPLKTGTNQLTFKKPNTNDFNNFIAINQIFMWVGNNGMGSHDPRTDGSGFYWPGGENATTTAIYQDGFVWGAKIGNEIRFNGSVYRQGLQAGKILPNGTADSPLLEKYRVFKIRKDWESLPRGPERDAYEKDYKEWPIEDGAPYELDKNGGKIPKFIGDEVLWCVSNDLDSSRTQYTYGTDPIGLEQQMTVFGFYKQNELGDIVFKKYKLINKGNFTLHEMYLGYWSDPDLGNAVDDYVGCDTMLNLGYCYNGDDNDENFYGAAPPSVGYVLLQGPVTTGGNGDSAKFNDEWRLGYKNLPLTSFIGFTKWNSGIPDANQGVVSGAISFYNYLAGRKNSGENIINPVTGAVTPFMLSGDPEEGTGWYEGPLGWPNGAVPPGDRRILLGSGPFTMAPGDTQEVVIGILMGRETSNLTSVTELKRKTKLAQEVFNKNFNVTVPPPSPKVNSFSNNGEITLYWEPNAESYEAVDPFLVNKGLQDSAYKFEGYRIWQFSDKDGADKTLLGMIDIKNDISKVTQTVDLNGVKGEQTLFTLPNQGLKRFYTTTRDSISHTRLKDGNPYYYGITSFAYSKESDTKYLESEPEIIEVRPASQPIDVTLAYQSGEYIIGKQVSGNSDAEIKSFVVDPLALTNDTYEITIDSLRDIITPDKIYPTWVGYNVVNVSKTPIDTLIKNSNTFGKDSSTNKFVWDGFSVVVENTGLESIMLNKLSQRGKYRVKSVEETKGSGGKVLETPVDVFNGKLNATKQWTIYPRSATARLNWQSSINEEAMGYEDYEIRFGDSSGFFLSGLQEGLSEKTIMTKTDSLCKSGKLPFSIWALGRYGKPSDAKRLFLKIKDRNVGVNDSTKAIPDRKWTRLANGEWEQVFAFQSSTLSYPALPDKELTASKITDHKIGGIAFWGELPAPGTVIRISGYKPLAPGDKFTVTPKAANRNDLKNAKENIGKISVFPNPYLGQQDLEGGTGYHFVRFIGLPKQVKITIVSLDGVLIRRYKKDTESQYIDWDLRNTDGLAIGSGVYIAYVEVPGAGTKILKIAVVQSQW